MTFLAPHSLLALAGVLVPILMHLLGRWRVRRLEFSSTLFLEAIRRTTLRWSRLWHLLILATRVCMVTLVALVLARPTCGPQPARTIVCLDVSASMGAERGSLWRLAQDAASRILQTCPGRVALGAASWDLVLWERPRQELREILARLQPGAGSLDVNALLERVEDATKGGTRLVLVSDFQATNWEAASPPRNTEVWGVALDPAPSNLRVEPEGALVFAGTVEVWGRVRALGSTPDSCVLTARAGSWEHTLAIPMGGAEAPFSFRLPADTLVRATVVVDDPWGPVADDHASLALWVPPRFKVLLLGPPGEVLRRIRLALDPQGTGAWGFEVGPWEPDSADVVVVTSALDPGTRLEPVLRAWEKGCGVVLVADDTLVSESGRHLWTLVMGGVPRGLRIPPQRAQLGPHPAVASLSRLPPPGFSPPEVSRAWEWEGLGTPLMTAGPLPLVVESPLRSRVVAFVTGVLPPWSDWATRASFVPFVHAVVAYAGGAVTSLAVPYGPPILWDVPWDGEAWFCPPEGSCRALVPELLHAGVARVRVGPFVAQGPHVVRTPGRVRALFEPTVPPAESATGAPARPPWVTRWLEEPWLWPKPGPEPGSWLLVATLALCVGEGILGLRFTGTRQGGER